MRSLREKTYVKLDLSYCISIFKAKYRTLVEPLSFRLILTNGCGTLSATLIQRYQSIV